MGRRRTFGNVRKLPSGRYQAHFLDASRHRCRAPRRFATVADTNSRLSATEAEIARCAWVDPRAGAITFAEHAEGWIESRPSLRPRAVELCRSLLDRHPLPALGDRQLGKVTTATGARLREPMHRIGRSAEAPDLRHQHATGDRDAVIARALQYVIEAGCARVSSEIDG